MICSLIPEEVIAVRVIYLVVNIHQIGNKCFSCCQWLNLPICREVGFIHRGYVIIDTYGQHLLIRYNLIVQVQNQNVSSRLF